MFVNWSEVQVQVLPTGCWKPADVLCWWSDSDGLGVLNYFFFFFLGCSPLSRPICDQLPIPVWTGSELTHRSKHGSHWSQCLRFEVDVQWRQENLWADDITKTRMRGIRIFNYGFLSSKTSVWSCVCVCVYGVGARCGGFLTWTSKILGSQGLLLTTFVSTSPQNSCCKTDESVT